MAKKKKKSGKWNFNDDRLPKLLGLFLLLVSVYLFLAFTAYLFTWKQDFDVFHPFSWSRLFDPNYFVENWLGRLGAAISNFFFYWGFGLPSFLLAYALGRLGLKYLLNLSFPKAYVLLRNTFLWMLYLSVLLELIFFNGRFPWGGTIGESLMLWVRSFIGVAGLVVLLMLALVALIIWRQNPKFEEMSPKTVQDDLTQFYYDVISGKVLRKPIPVAENKSAALKALQPGERWVDVEALKLGEREIKSGDQMEFELKDKKPKSKKDKTEETELEIEVPTTDAEPAAPAFDSSLVKGTEAEEGKEADMQPFDPTLELANYQYPPLSLLEDYSDQKLEVDREELEANKDQIIETLLNYKIEIVKIKATIGPTVTLYEIVPAPGVRISKIRNLEDDIALSLAALGIRIIAPIPGKGTIGIEVPNKHKQIVALKDVLNSNRFKENPKKMDLPIALGKTIANEIFVADLAKMPHLLIAGATGQGKSVGVNTIIMSLLYKQHPSKVKLVMIDPKKVELFPYAKLENHFLAYLPDLDEPIVTDTTKVVHTLNSLLIEMEQRYNLLKKAQARSIKEYNRKFVARKLNPEKGHRYLPFIVLVIDEFADLIMTAGKEIELPIGRLAQLSRAVGIHLIIATQRPSVNIITGVIKANFPARLAFKVTAKVDSRTILDGGGADRLIGRGDMLISFGSEIIRLQCAFVDTPEVERVINFIGAQPGYATPYFLPEFLGEEADMQGSGFDITDMDENFNDAARLVVQNQHGSTSMIQRRLKLGYNRAGRIMDQMEALGIVGPSEGSKAREVLIADEIELEKLLVQIHERRKELLKNNLFGREM